MLWVGQVGQRQTWMPQGLRGHVLFFCVYRILLTIAGQMRPWVSTTSDADQV